jgi:hypothetical protein
MSPWTGEKVMWCLLKKRVVEMVLIPNPTGRCLTSFLFKAQERLTQWHIDEVVGDMNHPRQHAFRKGHSTANALSETINELEKALLQGEFAVAIFLDIAGAFDCVSTDAIVDAMRRHKIPGKAAEWYEFYLRNRVCSSEIGSIIIII